MNDVALPGIPWRSWAHSKYDATTPPALASTSGTEMIPRFVEDRLGLARGRPVRRLDEDLGRHRPSRRPRRSSPRGRRAPRGRTRTANSSSAGRSGRRPRSRRRSPSRGRARGARRGRCPRRCGPRPRRRRPPRPHAHVVEEVDERRADLAVALDDGTRAADVDAEPLEDRLGARSTTPTDVAPAWPWVPPIATGLPVTTPGVELAADHRDRVHDPGHDLGVGVDVGRGDVAVRPEDRRDVEGVAAREPLELAPRQRAAGRRLHAALRAAERDVHDRALDRHVRGQRADLVHVDARVEAQAALAGAAARVVLDPPAGVHLDAPVVEANRDRDLEDPLGRDDHLASCPSSRWSSCGGLLEERDDLGPRVVRGAVEALGELDVRAPSCHRLRRVGAGDHACRVSAQCRPTRTANWGTPGDGSSSSRATGGSGRRPACPRRRARSRPRRSARAGASR